MNLFTLKHMKYLDFKMNIGLDLQCYVYEKKSRSIYHAGKKE